MKKGGGITYFGDDIDPHGGGAIVTQKRDGFLDINYISHLQQQ